MKNNPLVSIIIPVYNGSNYMRDAIDSALAQTYPNTEIIVINDGSTDNGKTDAIAKSYGNKIRYYTKKNGGVSSALNYGISKMKGEYFSWLSHDDMYLPEKIEEEINYLRQNNLFNKNVIIFSNYQVIDKNNKLLFEPIINHHLVTKHPIYALLRGAINGNTLLIPKKAFKEYGPFDEKLLCTQDYDKWFDMSKTYKFIHVPKALIQSRYHAEQATNTSPNVKSEGNRFWLKVIKSFNEKKRLELNGSNYAYYYYLIEFLKNTPYDEALAYCKEQTQKYPPERLPKEDYISYKGNATPFSKNPVIRVCQFIHREGLKNTLKRLHKKLAAK